MTGSAPDDFQLPVARDATCVDECYMHGLPGVGAPHPHGPGSCRQSCSLLRRPPPAPPKRVFDLMLAAIRMNGLAAVTEALEGITPPTPPESVASKRLRVLVAAVERRWPPPTREARYNVSYRVQRDLPHDHAGPPGICASFRLLLPGGGGWRIAQEHPGIAPFPVTATGDTAEDALEELAARLEIILRAAGVDPRNNVETP